MTRPVPSARIDKSRLGSVFLAVVILQIAPPKVHSVFRQCLTVAVGSRICSQEGFIQPKLCFDRLGSITRAWLQKLDPTATVRHGLKT